MQEDCHIRDFLALAGPAKRDVGDETFASRFLARPNASKFRSTRSISSCCLIKAPHSRKPYGGDIMPWEGRRVRSPLSFDDRAFGIRNRMRLPSGVSVLRSAIPSWNATAHRTASTTLANSASSPSPIVLTTLPLCSAMQGSISSLRWAVSVASVPSSSSPISRE